MTLPKLASKTKTGARGPKSHSETVYTTLCTEHPNRKENGAPNS